MHSFIFAVEARWPQAAILYYRTRLATRVARAGDLGCLVGPPLRRRQVLRRAAGFVPRRSNAAERDEPRGSWLPRLEARGETRRVRGEPLEGSATQKWRLVCLLRAWGSPSKSWPRPLYES